MSYSQSHILFFFLLLFF